MVGMMDEKKLAIYKAKLKSRTENNKIRNREIIRRRAEKNRLNKVKFTPPVPKVVTLKPKVETIERNIVPIVEKINKNKEFVFIIPSYNNESNYLKNLNSVLNQTYQNWRIVYVDDCSTDKTYDLVSKYIIEKNVENKVKLLKNDKNMGPAYSRNVAFKECKDDEICCLLDGDDWLYDSNVLEKLNRLYLDNDLLVSYGGTYKYENGKLNSREKTIVPFPENIVKNNRYRQHPWTVYPLRTGKAELFKSIPEYYLKDEEGEWIKCCTDMAIMWWVLERCDGKFMVNNFPTYVYNVDNTNKYITSYYRRKEDKSWEIYREKVMKQLIGYKCKKYVISDDQIKFNKYLEDNKIDQICISKSLSGFDRIKKIYNLNNYNPNSNQQALFFGVYDLKDLRSIINYKGNVYVIFGGTDCDTRVQISINIMKKLKQLKNITYIAQSKDIELRLNNQEFKCVYLYLNLVNYKIFKPIYENIERKYIYIYDGQGTITDIKKIIYNNTLIEEVKQRLPEYEYIHSSSLNQIPYEKMPEIYAKCFIGLRLTEKDGACCTSQELEAMNIPIVHNQSEYGLKWNNIDDIIDHINFDNISSDSINLIHCGTLIENENILQFIEKFLHIYNKNNNIRFTILYDDIIGSLNFIQKINDYILYKKNGLFIRKTIHYKTLKSNIGICCSGNNGIYNNYKIYDEDNLYKVTDTMDLDFLYNTKIILVKKHNIKKRKEKYYYSHNIQLSNSSIYLYKQNIINNNLKESRITLTNLDSNKKIFEKFLYVKNTINTEKNGYIDSNLYKIDIISNTNFNNDSKPIFITFEHLSYEKVNLNYIDKVHILDWNNINIINNISFKNAYVVIYNILFNKNNENIFKKYIKNNNIKYYILYNNNFFIENISNILLILKKRLANNFLIYFNNKICSELELSDNFLNYNKVEKIYCCLASYPKRKDLLTTTLNTLDKNNFNEINLYMNLYSFDFCSYISENFNITNILLDNLGTTRAAGKFFWCNQYNNYYFICDDDINYPIDYKDIGMLNILKNDNAIYSCLGARFKKYINIFPVSSQRILNIKFSEYLNKNTKVHLIGTGVSFFKSKNTNFPSFEYFLEYVVYNDDLLAIWCKKNNIDLFTIEKKKGWINSNDNMEIGLYEEKSIDPDKLDLLKMYQELQW